MARARLYPPSVDPGFPSLPATPSGWTRCTFGEIVDVVEHPIRLQPTSRYQLVTAKRNRGGIVGRSELLGREVLTKTQFQVRAGDFLISRRQIIHGACGVVPVSLDGAIVSNEYSSLRTRPSLSMEFLRQYSHTPYFQRTCFHSSHGVDVEKMVFKIDEWLRWPVDAPPLPEQQRIAAILSSFDDAIEKSEAVIAQLQIVKTAMMQELLTRGIPGRHTRFKMTEMGDVPEEWRVCTVSDVTSPDKYSCVGGPFGSDLTSKDYTPEGVPVIRGANLNGSARWLREGGFVFVSAEKAEALSRNLAYPGDLVFTQRGTLGQVARIPCGTNWPRFLLSQSQMKLKVDERSVDPDFVCFYFQSPEALAAIAKATIATGLPHINLGILKAFRLPVPSLEEQKSIVATLDAVDHRLVAELVQRDAKAALKSALASVLLTGEVRVTIDQEVAA